VELLFGLLVGLVLLSIPFVLPIVSWVYARGTRTRVEQLEAALEQQKDSVERLTARLVELRREMRTASTPEGAPTTVVTPRPAEPPRPVEPPRPAEPPRPVEPPKPIEPKPIEPKPIHAPAPAPVPTPAPPLVEHKPAALAGPPMPVVTGPPPSRIPAAEPPRRTPPPPAIPPGPPRPPEPPPTPFDWESLVGVKLFSGIAGVALVVAAIFFLRYSIEHGWLQPPVRVLIGILVGVGLLVVCEMKAARRYPVTANALDAAAIAILFSTFFAAHALWDLIPASVTFGLLGIVTAVAVLLSIRRESLFIALLGLVGGFATPALLSTGENRPIPLFAYLLLLNVGLAWVAQRQAWPVLSVLTLVLTTIYQWGWVMKFLAATDLSLAMGIFLVFPVATFAAVLLGRRARAADSAEDGDAFELTAVVSAALPLLFAVYLAAVPEYGARAGLLFGFLLLLDAGLFAIAVGRGQPLLHAGGAVATLLVMAIWLANSYATSARHLTIAFTAAFVLFYLAAPVVARWFDRPLEEAGEQAEYAAPSLLFVFVALAAMEPAFAAPLVLFGALGVLLAACAARAIATQRAFLYFIGAFFAVATQAVWSTEYLTPERLRGAVAIYAFFGLFTLGVPLLARRLNRPLEPQGAAGLMQLTSLGLLLYLTRGSVAPEALWALALLLAIMNAGLFIESASGGLPLLSQAGSVFSWLILATWWWRAAGSVGLFPSLAVLTGLTLITLGGHAWAQGKAARADEEADRGAFRDGLYLGLAGHLFLFMLAQNREWSVPPWPLFGTLLVLTLATSAAALVTRTWRLHAAGIVAAATVVAAWTPVAAVAPWPLVGLAASAVAVAYALLWPWVTRRFTTDASSAIAAVAVLFLAEVTAIAAAAAPGAPSFWILLAAHAVMLPVLIAISWGKRWHPVVLGAVAIAWFAVISWKIRRDMTVEWPELLVFTGVVYAIFTAYPLVLGKRAAESRQPWIAALVAAAMAFLLAHDAFQSGNLDWMIGVVPVVQGLVSAVLLRALLRIEPAGQRDIGRLALVAGAALAFITVAIPLQLDEQWWTIGWALEGAALAWLYGRIPHRGLLYASVALLSAVFVRLALNPEVFRYEPRGELRILNWYLYAYVLAAAAFFLAAWWLSRTDEEIVTGLPRPSRALAAGAVVLLFLLLNIEIADFYATGPEIVFRFGSGVSQDLTYTIGWLVFGMLLLAAGIYTHTRAARVTAVTMIAVTAFKCFLYDLGSLEGLYRVASFVGLAVSLALVSLALQKFVLSRPKESV
jgi:uncharacterized membrane protein